MVSSERSERPSNHGGSLKELEGGAHAGASGDEAVFMYAIRRWGRGVKPFKTLLMRIPDRRVRRWVTIGVLFAVSLLIGRLLETVLDKKTLAGLYSVERGWISGVQALTPFGLVSGYVGDVQAAMRGEWTYSPSRTPAMSAEIRNAATAQQAACTSARVSRSMHPNCATRFLAGGSAAACVVDETKPGCADYIACINANPSDSLMSTPPECIGVDISNGFGATSPAPERSSAAPHPLLIPLAALVHGATRLAGGGAGAITLAILQIGFGLAAFLFLSSSLSKTKEAGFGNAIANITLGPLAVITLGSLLALVLQGLMLGALYAFSWVTGFAAAAAGATGLAGGCWYCFTKIAEKGIESRVSH